MKGKKKPKKKKEKWKIRENDGYQEKILIRFSLVTLYFEIKEKNKSEFSNTLIRFPMFIQLITPIVIT